MHNNRITQSIIVGLTTLVATANWSGLKSILWGEGGWIWPSVGFLILLLFISLCFFLAKSRTIMIITLAIVLVSFIFAFGFRWQYLPILLVSFLLLLFGSLRAIDEKEDRVKIQVFRILKRGLPYVMTGLALAIATAYYFSPLIIKEQNEIKIPRPLFDFIAEPIIGSFEEQMPVYEIQNQFGISVINEEAEIKDIVYQEVNQIVNKHSQNYKQYFPLGLAIGLFFAVKAISIPFMWLVILLSVLIFKILVSCGAIKIQEKAVLKEVIEV